MGASGARWGLALFPLGAAVIAAAFGTMLLRRFAAGRRMYEVTWSLALFMYAAASLAAFAGVADGWSTVEYRVYWLLGAVLNVVFLAQGELYLLIRNRLVAHLLMFVVVIVSALSVVVLTTAPVRAAALAKTLPLGREALGDETFAYQLRWLSWIGYLILLGGTVWSAWRMRGQPHLRERTGGTLLIALGATVVAIGSGVGAGFGIVPLFSISLALGIAVIFRGFLVASASGGKRTRRARAAA